MAGIIFSSAVAARIMAAVRKIEGGDPNPSRRTRRQPVIRGGSGIRVLEEDGSPDLSDITEVELDEDDGFVLSNPSAGRAKIKLNADTIKANLGLGDFQIIDLTGTVTDTSWTTVLSVSGTCLDFLLSAVQHTIIGFDDYNIRLNVTRSDGGVLSPATATIGPISNGTPQIVRSWGASVNSLVPPFETVEVQVAKDTDVSGDPTYQIRGVLVGN